MMLFDMWEVFDRLISTYMLIIVISIKWMRWGYEDNVPFTNIMIDLVLIVMLLIDLIIILRKIMIFLSL